MNELLHDARKSLFKVKVKGTVRTGTTGADNMAVLLELTDPTRADADAAVDAFRQDGLLLETGIHASAGDPVDQLAAGHTVRVIRMD